MKKLAIGMLIVVAAGGTGLGQSTSPRRPVATGKVSPPTKAVAPRIDQVVPWPAPEAAGMIIDMQLRQPLLKEHVGQTVVWRGRKWADGGQASNAVHVMRIGDQHYNLSLALCASNPIAQFPPGAMLDVKGKLAPFYDRFRQYGTSRWTVYLEDGATATLAKEQPPDLPPAATGCQLCGGIPDIVVETPAMMSARRLMPAFEKALAEGSLPLRLTNDQPTSYVVGLRCGGAGKDVEVPPQGAITVYIAAGTCDVYVFSPTQQSALFQAPSLTFPLTAPVDVLRAELKQIK